MKNVPLPGLRKRGSVFVLSKQEYELYSEDDKLILNLFYDVRFSKSRKNLICNPK